MNSDLRKELINYLSEVVAETFENTQPSGEDFESITDEIIAIFRDHFDNMMRRR